MDKEKHPSENQVSFLERNILHADTTILTLKVVRKASRGFSVNIRGPFILAPYKFADGTETVITADWAGPQESRSHLHCCWTEVRFARRSRTNQKVQGNTGYQWEISFFATEEDARIFLDRQHPEWRNDLRLFWFYLENDNHKAVPNMPEGELFAVA